MKNYGALLVTTVCSVQFLFVIAGSDACGINRCQCSRNPHASYDDVTCFINSITSSDNTMQALPSDVQSLILSCSSPGSLSFLSADIFEKFPSLISLTIQQCNISILAAESFRVFTSLTNLSIIDSFLPLLHPNTFMHLSGLRYLTIIYCNITIFPDISHLKFLQYLNVSHNNLSHVEVTSLGTSGEGTNLTQTDSGDSSQRNDLNDMRILDLSFNNISVTPVSLIERTPHVQELYLTGLSLSQLSIPETIRLKDLIILDAMQNLLQVVDFPSLRTATKMKELRLEGTGFPLSCHGLSYLINLEELLLNNFGTTDAVWQEFNSTVLARLSLINNSLTTVDIGGLSALRVLQLAKNNISYLSNITFINQPDLLLVNLSDNKIQSLPADLFQNNFHIKAMDFAGNSLSTLEYGTFKGLKELFYLDLTNNLLSYLPYTLFKDLSSMLYLKLNGNELKWLPKLSYMAGLYTLDISNNKLSMLQPHQLQGLDKLESLFVNDNKLTILPPNLFSECPSLLQVYLHNNQIADMGSLGAHNKLLMITLYNNQLTDFITESPFIHLTSLQYLFLDSNNLTSLRPNTFPPSIVTLFLNGNNIQQINPGTFNNLGRLSFVSLTDNRCVLSIPLNVVNVFKINSPKPTFNIERNVFLCDCNLGYLKAISENEHSVLVFNVYYPRFVGLDNARCYTPNWGEAFRPFKEVPTSHFVCAYTDTWCDVFCECCNLNTPCDCLVSCPSECKCVYGGSGFTKLYISVQCGSANLKQVPAGIPSRTTLLYLDGNKLSHLTKENFIHLRKTEEIYLNKSAIQSIDIGTFDNIPTIKILLLNDNLLTTIPENLFGNMNEIKEIYLHSNLINSISPVAFLSLSSVEIVTLHNNKLVLLTALPQLPRQLSITLSGNPWSCDCNVSKVIIRTVYEMNQVIQDAGKMCCVFSNDSIASFIGTDVEKYPIPDIYQNVKDTIISTGGTDDMRSDDGTTGGTDDIRSGDGTSLSSSDFGRSCFPLLRFDYDDYCIPKVSNSTFLMPVANAGFHPGFISLIVITSILCLVASAVVLILFKRRELQAWIFAKTGVRILDKKEHLDKEDASSKVFHAFISHSSKDADFVAGTLTPALEHGDRKYRLCIHYRDFPVGRNITDTICRAIENSSRTILLLSAHFLTSEWCRFEFQTAHYHILREGSHRLIIILLEDIPDHMLDPDLKVHMKSKTYLKYGDPWFWEKLYFAMPSIKDTQGDNDNQRMDILRGMKILAGEDDALDQVNLQNQDNEIRHECGGQAMNLFNQFQSNETRQLQDHENGTEEINSNCHRKPIEHHGIKGFHNTNDCVKEHALDDSVEDLAVESGDGDSVGNDNCCNFDELGNSTADEQFNQGQYLPQVSDVLNNQKYLVDDKNEHFQERNHILFRNSKLRLKYEINSESTDETHVDKQCVDVSRTTFMTDEDTGAGNDNVK